MRRGRRENRGGREGRLFSSHFRFLFSFHIRRVPRDLAQGAPASARSRARVVMVLLLDDFAFLDTKGVEGIKRFSVGQYNFRLCRDPSLLTGIVTHDFHIAERGQYACEEIKDGFPSANQCVLAARWIERSP